MEEVAWIFNGDFEDRLFEQRFDSFQPSKMTQEFEYFIHLLEPAKTIFSQKKYSSFYQERIEQLTGESFKVTDKAKKILPWCQTYENYTLLQKLQNKSETLKFLVENGFNHQEIEFVNQSNELESGYLYKYPKSLSGMGHFTYPKDKKKIEKLISQGETLIKEKVHQRTLDFSTLVEDGKVVCSYANYIDNHFQYKGTFIEEKFELPKKFQVEFGQWLEKVLTYTQEYTGIMSLDSYLYDDGGEEVLFPVCEINARKTMGYVAYHLKKKYFHKYPCIKLSIIRNKLNSVEDFKWDAVAKENMFLLSPVENRFWVMVFWGEDKQEVQSLEESLLARIF